MYKLSLDRVPENGAHQVKDLVLSAESLGLSAPFDGAQVQVHFQLQRHFEKVYAQIQVETRAHLECARCLKAFDGVLRSDFTVRFGPSQAAEADDVDVDLQDETVPLEGDEIPLGEEVRQELELRLPFTATCRPDCAGLCTVCGHDLNDGDCGCDRGVKGGPFAALSDLLKKKQP